MRAWRDLVDDATSRLGLVSPALVRHWRAELDEVERRVALLECSAPSRPRPSTACTRSSHSPPRGSQMRGIRRNSSTWQRRSSSPTVHRSIIGEFAIHPTKPDAEGCPNARVVLDGDWSITQAAVLVADIGPAAYRCLVRGYGSTQVGQLFGDAEPLALMKAAVELAANGCWLARRCGAQLVGHGDRRPRSGIHCASIVVLPARWFLGGPARLRVGRNDERPQLGRRRRRDRAPIDVQLPVEINHDEPGSGQVVAQPRWYLRHCVVGCSVVRTCPA